MKNKIIVALSVIGAILIYVVAGGVGRFLGGSVADNYESSRQNTAIAEAQAQVAAEMRKQLPLKVDEFTTLQTVLSVGPTIIYSYVIDIQYDEIEREAFSDDIFKQLKFNVCQETNMLSVMSAGGIYTYTYASADGKSLGSYTLNKRVCGSSE